MDYLDQNSLFPTLSEELRLAIKEENILSKKFEIKYYSALDNEKLKTPVFNKQVDLRQNVVTEIYSSEITYLQKLETIMKYFMKPLRSKSWLSHSTFNALFGNIEVIYKVNGELVKELKKGMDHIAIAFIEMAPYFKLYSVYAYQYKRALEILQSMIKNNKDLNNFITLQEKRPEVATSIQSLLIVPIQRIPRYRLLLLELLNHTEKNDENYVTIKDALGKIEQTAKHVNKLVTEYEEAQEILLLCRRIIHNPIDIIVPGRKIIKQGCLKKLSKSGRTSNQRYLVLFNDALMFCKGKKDGILKFSSLISLRYCHVESIFGSRVFKILIQNEVIILYTADSNLGKEWVTALQVTVKECQTHRKTLNKETSRRKLIKRLDVLDSVRKTLVLSFDFKCSTSCFKLFNCSI